MSKLVTFGTVGVVRDLLLKGGGGAPNVVKRAAQKVVQFSESHSSEVKIVFGKPCVKPKKRPSIVKGCF